MDLCSDSLAICRITEKVTGLYNADKCSMCSLYGLAILPGNVMAENCLSINMTFNYLLPFALLVSYMSIHVIPENGLELWYCRPYFRHVWRVYGNNMQYMITDINSQLRLCVMECF